jgi:hypothetical protein
MVARIVKTVGAMPVALHRHGLSYSGLAVDLRGLARSITPLSV